jgi:effector-binding domain-containing protein
MAKTKAIKKIKIDKIKPINEKYYVHMLEPAQKMDGFKFLELSTYLKKIKKNSSGDIFIGDLLEYFSVLETTQVLNELISKLSSESKIFIQGIDAKSVAYNFATDQIDSNMFISLLYNNGTKKTVFTFPNIKYIIKNIDGIEITNIKFINSINYYIECQKK